MKILFGLTLLLAGSLTAIAQQKPEIEVFGGFSYANYDVAALNSEQVTSTNCTADCCVSTSTSCPIGNTIATTKTIRMNLLGWNGSATAYLTRYFGLTLDVSGHYSGASEQTTIGVGALESVSSSGTTITSIQETVQASSPKVHNFLFGPQMVFPTKKARGYAHVLLGERRMSVQTTYSAPPSDVSVIVTNSNSLAAGTVFAMAFGGGVDYPVRKNVFWRVGADYLTNQGTAQDHVRVSTGLVWRFGK